MCCQLHALEKYQFGTDPVRSLDVFERKNNPEDCAYTQDYRPQCRYADEIKWRVLIQERMLFERPKKKNPGFQAKHTEKFTELVRAVSTAPFPQLIKHAAIRFQLGQIIQAFEKDFSEGSSTERIPNAFDKVSSIF